MKYIVFSLLIAIVVISCSANKSHLKKNSAEIFTKELKELKEYFSIPGIAAIIEQDGEVVYEQYFGYADLEVSSKLDTQTTFPIASLSKTFSAVLIMKLVEQGKLSLDAPVSQFFPSFEIDDSIKVKHLLSHTSQGEVGKQFYYSSRFGLLTNIIEMASEQSFSDLMQREIFDPIDLQHTFLLKDSLQLEQMAVKMASPYMLDGEIQRGFIDYGYSTSAGIVSTAKDLMRFNRALDLNLLITKESKEQMFSPFQDALPYGYGIFTQKVEGVDVVWAYGQYDCYSSLLLKVPSKKISLVLLANNNLMSDPARLIMGDLNSSLFALSFLKNYVLGLADMQLIEAPDSVYNSSFSDRKIYRNKVLAQALAESFMARFDTDKLQKSASLIERTLDLYPDYLAYANINLLHNLNFLKNVAFYMELGEFNQFDEEIEKIGEKLLKEEKNNPYLHVYLGTYYDRKGEEEKARFHYESIVQAENFSPNWYTSEAENWLNENR